MDKPATVIPGRCNGPAQSADLLAVNPESRREYRPAVSLLDSEFKRCALAPE
jgi:hypothetical protein